MHVARLAAVLALAAAIAPSASAQWIESNVQALVSITGPLNGDLFGWRVAAAGDVNGDGIPDFCVSAPFFHQGAGLSKGRVSMHSGADGALMWSKAGAVQSAVLGFELTTVGDIDGDGAREVVAGAPFAGNGSAFVWSGKTGNLLHTFTGAATNDSCGYSIATGGDFDGDGVEDIAVASYGADVAGPDAGEVIVYSSATFAVIATIDPPAGDVESGAGLAFLGDVDGDQRDELAIGSRVAPESVPGRVRAYGLTGATPTVRYTIPSCTMGPPLDGNRLAGGQDVDHDGVNDLLAGELSPGQASLFSAATGALIRVYTNGGNDSFGSARLVPDQDGDGTPDVLVGARGDDVGATNGGRVSLFSGASHAVLQQFTCTAANSSFGAGADLLGDVNQDGVAEIVVGAMGSQPLNTKGKAFVLTTAPCVASWSNYGAGLAGTLGVPGLSLSAAPKLGTSVDLQLGNSRGATTPAVIVLGPAPAFLPTGWGGALLVAPSFSFALSVPAAGVALPASIANVSALCGHAAFLQAFESDSGAAHGVAETRGLEVHLGL